MHSGDLHKPHARLRSAGSGHPIGLSQLLMADPIVQQIQITSAQPQASATTEEPRTVARMARLWIPARRRGQTSCMPAAAPLHRRHLRSRSCDAPSAFWRPPGLLCATGWQLAASYRRQRMFKSLSHTLPATGVILPLWAYRPFHVGRQQVQQLC